MYFESFYISIFTFFEADIAKYDSDGVISFHHTSQKSKYQDLYEDFEVLYRFTGKVGNIVDRTIDQPFYKDMDAFVEAMRDLSITNYTTKNRLGITETVYATEGLYNSTEVEKAQVSLEDLFSGDNLYAKQMQLEYEEWKKLNPDQDFSGKEYKQAALSGRAFEYESIRDQQENKEFLVQMGILGVTVISAGIAFFCPPAGIALLTAIGAASGAMEVKSAVTGKDWVSGRELGTGERALRGTFGALDLVPGVGSITKFSGTVRLTRVCEGLGQFGLKTGVKKSLQQGISRVDNLVKTAEQQSAARLKSAAAAIKGVPNAFKNKLIKDGREVKDLAESGLTKTRDFIGNLIPSRKMGYSFAGAGDAGSVHVPAGSGRAEGNTINNVTGKEDEVNLGGSSKMEKAPLEISEADRIKIESWAHPPDPEHYLKYKKTYDNPNYFDQETGRTIYPGTNGDPNIDGFLDGKYDDQNLTKGTIIDRYGDNGTGRYFSPDGSSFESRALPPFMRDKPYERYIVLRDFECKSGIIAPWFDQEGYGTQFFTDYKIKDLKGTLVDATVKNLIKNNYISILK